MQRLLLSILLLFVPAELSAQITTLFVPVSLPNCERADMSMVAVGNCVDAEAAKADASLRQAYSAALAGLNPAQRAILQRSQRAWISMRDADTELMYSMVEGNHPSLSVVPTRIGMTLERVTFLQSAVTAVAIADTLAAMAPAPTMVDTLAYDEAEAYVAAMKSDLRNMATYEESYAADSGGKYFSGNGATQGFTPSQNVTVTARARTNPNRWSATASHALTARTCAMSVEGLITCR